MTAKLLSKDFIYHRSDVSMRPGCLKTRFAAIRREQKPLPSRRRRAM